MNNGQDINRYLIGILDRLRGSATLWKKIGMRVVTEIKKNFDEQGRPEKWKPSKAALKRHGQTLRKTGRLMRSFTSNQIENGVEVGTNVKYAPYLEFGVTRAPRSEIFLRSRISRGSHVGRFKRMSQTRYGRGFTYRQYSLGPWDFLYVSPEAVQDFRKMVANEVTRLGKE